MKSKVDGYEIDDTYIVMAGGLPNPDVFPVKSARLTLGDGTEVTINEDEMAVALQYGTTSGRPELLKFVTDLIKRLHDPPTMNDPGHPGAPTVLLSNGAQDGLFKCLDCILEEGDVILSEEPVYSGFHAVAAPIGCKMLPVQTDRHGIIIDDLAKILSNFPKHGEKNNQSSPGKLKALYCVPNGDNPTGCRYSLERRQDIYRLAHEYNFLIIEDDAYYFMEKRPLIPSLLSMDSDGRVIRLDTFSKTVAPGLRLGSVFGPAPLMQSVLYLSQSSSQGSSGVAQAMLLALVRKWGIDGYIKHCEKVGQFYDGRRSYCVQMVRKYLDGLVEFHEPTGGMFLWLKFLGITDSKSFIWDRLLIKHKLMIVAGAAFYQDLNAPTPYARVSYSTCTDEEMEKAFSIIAEELKAEVNSRK